MQNILDSFPDQALTAEQEAKLSERGKHGDLAVANMYQAVLYANTCCGGKIEDQGELVSLCYDAMTKAAENFTPEKGRFFAFAKPRIRGALLRYWNTTAATVRNAETLGGYEEAQDDGEVDELELDRMEIRERLAQVNEIVATRCTDRERAIMHMIFSLNFTYAEVGKMFDISRAAAQAIASKVIVKVKRLLNK